MESDSAKTVGQSAAYLGDALIGGVTGAAQAGAYALERPFMSAEKAREHSRLPESWQHPIGSAFGVTETEGYKKNPPAQLMNFISENVERGAKWIAEKTGVPQQDVENMMGTLGLVVPGAAKATARGAVAAGKQAVENAGKVRTPGTGTPGAQKGIIKLGGGNWLKGEVEEAVEGLKTTHGELKEHDYTHPSDIARVGKKALVDQRTGEIFKLDYPHREEHNRAAAVNTWVDKVLVKYIKNQMGTAEDPIRKLAEEGIVHYPRVDETDGMAARRRRFQSGYPMEGLGQSEAARRWEDQSDVSITQINKTHLQEQAAGVGAERLPYDTAQRRIREAKSKLVQNPWLEKIPDNAKIYAPSTGHMENLGFDHIVDVIKEDLATGRLDQDKLGKYSIEAAVRRTHQYDEELKARQRQDSAARMARMPRAAEYEDGTTIFQLKNPGDFAAESDAMRNSVRGYEPPKGHSDWAPESKNSGRAGYGHGGWEAIKSGKAQAYSVRDKDGTSHATIEVNSRPEPWNTRNSIFYNNPELEPSWVEFSEEKSKEAKVRGEQRDPNYIREYPAWLRSNHPEVYKKHEEVFRDSPPSISQIKGQGNGNVSLDVQEHIQDFLNSREWGEVRDLNRVGLIDLKNQNQTLPTRGPIEQRDPVAVKKLKAQQMLLDNGFRFVTQRQWSQVAETGKLPANLPKRKVKAEGKKE